MQPRLEFAIEVIIGIALRRARGKVKHLDGAG